MKTATQTPAIPKGEMLDRIFKHRDELNYFEKMINLFTKNGMSYMDLTELQERDSHAYKQWYKMYRRSNRLTAFMTHTILQG